MWACINSCQNLKSLSNPDSVLKVSDAMPWHPALLLLITWYNILVRAYTYPKQANSIYILL